MLWFIYLMMTIQKKKKNILIVNAVKSSICSVIYTLMHYQHLVYMETCKKSFFLKHVMFDLQQLAFQEPDIETIQMSQKFTHRQNKISLFAMVASLELMSKRFLKLQRSYSHECTDEYQLYQLDLMEGEEA